MPQSTLSSLREPVRSYLGEASRYFNQFLNCTPPSERIRLLRKRFDRVVDEVQKLSPRLNLSAIRNALAKAISFDNYNGDNGFVPQCAKRLAAAEDTSDEAWLPFCDALVLMQLTPRGPASDFVREANARFAAKLHENLPSAPSDAGFTVLAKMLGATSMGISYEALMTRGLPEPAQWKAFEWEVPAGQLAVLASAALFLGFDAPELMTVVCDEKFARGMNEQVLQATAHVIPLKRLEIAAYIERTSPDLLQYLDRFKHFEDTDIESLPIAVVCSDAIAAWLYLNSQEVTGTNTGFTALQLERLAKEGSRRGRACESAYWKSAMHERRYALKCVVACPACRHPADVTVHVLPTKSHTGEWHLRCACGHVESRYDREDWRMRWSIFRCDCQHCTTLRDGIRQRMAPVSRSVSERTKRSETLVTALMEDALQGRNGLSTDEEGHVLRDGQVIGHYSAPLVLPWANFAPRDFAEVPDPSSIDEKARRGQPWEWLRATLGQDHDKWVCREESPMLGEDKASARLMDHQPMDEFKRGFDAESDASFKAWARAVEILNHRTFALPLSITVWEKGTPVPTWMPPAERAKCLSASA